MILRYKTQADADSMSNTPNTFGIYMLNLMLGWIKDDIGGLAAMHERNKRKAALLYGAIDASGGFYRGHAQKDSRSLMNVSFNIADAALEPVFSAASIAARSASILGTLKEGIAMLFCSAMAQISRRFTSIRTPFL